MPVTDVRRQALIALACVAVPLGLNLWLRAAIVGAPLVAFFPAIAIATVFAGRVAGLFVGLAALVAAVLETTAPPLNFSLGLSLNGQIFLAAYALSGGLIYLVIAHVQSQRAVSVREAGEVVMLSSTVARWLSSNVRAAAALMGPPPDGAPSPAQLAEAGLLQKVARERLAMAAGVERQMRNWSARDGADLSDMMTTLCHEAVRKARRSDLPGAISIAPMALDHEDFLRVCLIFADVLFLAFREDPSSEQPLRVNLRQEGRVCVLDVMWLRRQTPAAQAMAHRIVTGEVAGRLAQRLGGELHLPDAGARLASATLRFPLASATRPAKMARGRTQPVAA